MHAVRSDQNIAKIIFGIMFIFFFSAGDVISSTKAYKMLARKIAAGAKSLENRKIAILPFIHHDGSTSSGSIIISERLITYISEFKSISVIERTLLNEVMKEHKLAETGIIDQATTKEIGKILGVEAIVTGTLINIENKLIEINARMIHTETGKILSAGRITVKRTWEEEQTQELKTPRTQSSPQPRLQRPGTAYDRLEVVFKIGSDFQGKVVWDGTIYQTYYDIWGDRQTRSIGVYESYDVNNGISLSSEVIVFVNDHFGLGFGLTIQMARELTDYGAEFYYLPIYGLCKIRFPQETVSPYLIGQGGYNFLNGDDTYTYLEGGVYAGIGTGLQFNNGFLLELLYSINFGYLEISGLNYYEIDLWYKKLRFSAGFAF